MVKTVKRIIGFKTRVKAQEHAKRNRVRHPRYGWNKKHKHFYEN